MQVRDHRAHDIRGSDLLIGILTCVQSNREKSENRHETHSGDTEREGDFNERKAGAISRSILH